jgi:hypothetical protein
MAKRAGEDHNSPYNIERLADDRYQISLAVAGSAPIFPPGASQTSPSEPQYPEQEKQRDRHSGRQK